jgi:hypothetical protein
MLKTVIQAECVTEAFPRNAQFLLPFPWSWSTAATLRVHMETTPHPPTPRRGGFPIAHRYP